ncbi:MAG: multiheme c-type cytochrome [Candidatus Bipolaricaulia bacterium]
MRRTLIAMSLSLSLVAALLVLQTQPLRSSEPENTCVSCHRELPDRTLVAHTFLPWQDSSHAQAGVTCEACHGGNPVATDRESAHEGIYSSRDPRSKVYFTNIPRTCGSCHGEVFRNFSESLHYRQLETTGRGPNCVTCHGFMAIHVLEPEELQATCSVCHNERLGISPDKPIQARYLLSMMNRNQTVIDLVDRLIEQERVQGFLDTAETKALLVRAVEEMETVRVKWHSFALAEIEAGIDRAFDLAKAALERLGE